MTDSLLGLAVILTCRRKRYDVIDLQQSLALFQLLRERHTFQVIDIIKKHRSGELEQQARSTWVMGATAPTKPVWDRKHKWDGVGDPAEDKNQVIATPAFAFDWEHQVCGVSASVPSCPIHSLLLLTVALG